MMKIARKEESGYMSYHMSSGGSGLSRPKPQVKLLFLIYGSEAILPADIMWKSPRVEMYNEGEVDEARQLELDSVEEARCTTPFSQLDTCRGFGDITIAT
jgi:hypothetical protein